MTAGDFETALEQRRRLARQIAQMGNLASRVADRLAYCRLERDRLVKLGFELRHPSIAGAVEHVDAAIRLLAGIEVE